MKMDRRCCICGHVFTGSEDRGICPGCQSRPRVRSIVPLLEECFVPGFGSLAGAGTNALCFAMTVQERQLWSRYLGTVESVSLFGTYGKAHTLNVDARDLSRYGDDTFSAHYSCLLFDYFTEHEQALREAFRVLAPGGLFITHIQDTTLVDGDAAPETVSVIKARPGYYEYIPEGQSMLHIRVSSNWFLEMMRTVGFKSHLFRIIDHASGIASSWFVGQKPRDGADDACGAGSREKSQAPCKAEPLRAPEVRSAGIAPVKEYSIPMPAGLPFRHVTVRLEIPRITEERVMARFSEHVAASDRVVACAVGGFFLSEDLGQSWRKVLVKGHERVRFVNAFSLPDGSFCLQTKGRSPKLAPEKQDDAGLVVVSDGQGMVRSASRLSVCQWHGTSSVDFKDGVLMYADYALNLPLGRDEGSERYASAVLRSLDGGGTWSRVFELSRDQARHFHTLRADPFQKDTWYLTSGDLSQETMIWVSRDNGDSWQKAFEPEPDTAMSRFRMTDMVITEQGIIWGSDDILGFSRNMSPDLPLGERVGARIFFADRDDLGHPTEVGYAGQPVRSFVDLGACWFVITQGTFYEHFTRPQVFLLTKSEPYRFLHLFDTDNYGDQVTGFTYSCQSRVARDGVFFTFRGPKDVFDEPGSILKWTVHFD